MDETINKISGKRLFFAILCVVGYFILLLAGWFINSLNKGIDFILNILGFFHEILLFPLMFIVQPALLVLSIIHCIKEKFRIKSYSFWSFLILLISNSFCIGSFFIESLDKWIMTLLVR